MREEDQPEDERDAADRGGQGVDPPQQQPDGDGQERGEDDLGDVHEQPAPDLVLQLRVDVTLAGGVNQGQDRPQERCPEHDYPRETETGIGSVHRSPLGWCAPSEGASVSGPEGESHDAGSDSTGRSPAPSGLAPLRAPRRRRFRRPRHRARAGPLPGRGGGGPALVDQGPAPARLHAPDPAGAAAAALRRCPARPGRGRARPALAPSRALALICDSSVSGWLWG